MKKNNNENFNYNEIYNKTFDYDDMKIAICIADFSHINEKFEKKFADFENIILEVVEIHNNWFIDNDLGNLSFDEVGNIQSYATRYLAEKYLEV